MVLPRRTFDAGNVSMLALFRTVTTHHKSLMSPCHDAGMTEELTLYFIK
jgi:hypothetical protein